MVKRIILAVEILFFTTMMAMAYYHSVKYDAFERLYQFSRQYENYEIDEIISIVIVAFLFSFVYLIRSFIVLSRKNRIIREKSDRDYLTGIFNRRKISELIEEDYHRRVRYKGMSTIILMDLDHFKEVNDSLGHKAGDLLLKEVTSRISPLLRQSDSFGRYGGDEFLILLPETEIEKGRQVARRIKSELTGKPFVYKNKLIDIFASFGISSVSGNEEDINSAFLEADKKLYESKRKGRNQIH